MALTLSDVGLEAKDQGVLKSAWIVQINGVVVFETKIHSCQITIMRSVINTELPNLPGKWSGGSYCILANGDCPSGFTRYEGYLRALKINSCSSTYVKETYFGNSSLNIHGDCHYGDSYYVEIHMKACCK